MSQVRFFIVLCGLLALRGLLVVWDTIAHYERYQTLNVVGSLPVRAGLNLVFALVFLRVAWGLWRRQRAAYRALPYAIAAYLGVNLLWFRAFAQNDFDQGRWGFALVTSLILMCYILWRWRRMKKKYLETTDD